MAAIITEKFRLHNAEQFLESFSETNSNNYYLFIGKSTPYTAGTTGGSDENPPVPNDDVVNEFRSWDAMLAAKKITSSDVDYVIPRKSYDPSLSPPATYDMYRHDISSSNPSTSGATSLWESDFYFVTPAYRVYKILDNDGGNPFTGPEPTNETTSPSFVGNYYLKYMFKLSASSVVKFLTNDFHSVLIDSNVSGAASNGTIEVVSVTNGSGYVQNSTGNSTFTVYAKIKGDGSNGVVRIYVDNGSIVKFGNGSSYTGLINSGTDYSYAYVDLNEIFSDSACTVADSFSAGNGGSIVPIIPPKGGHGKNAIAELAGHYVMLNAKLLQNDNNDFTVVNDFREVGIVVDPLVYDDLINLFTGTTARMTIGLQMSGAPIDPYVVDEKVTQTTSGAVGRVVEWDSVNNILYVIQELYTNYGLNDSTGSKTVFVTGDPVVGSSPSVSATPSSIINPEMEPYSGNIIYNEKRNPIFRASDQTEDVKIIVEF
jgi:hypothetical protein